MTLFRPTSPRPVRPRFRRPAEGAPRIAAAVLAGLLLTSCGTPGAGPGAPPSALTGPPTSAPSSAGAPTQVGRVPTTPPPPPSSAVGSPSATATTSPACSAVVARLSLREQVGQLFMVGVPTSGLTSGTARTLSQTRAGSVILLGNTGAGSAAVARLVNDVRDAGRRPEGVRTLLAADQEGGLVQRLKGDGFADMPSARTQGTWSAQRLRSSAEDWGRELRRAGIDADLAPVADVVPRRLLAVNQPIGVLRRGFSSDPAVVASHSAAFVEGMDRAGVATAVKHFPGLGAVRGNTDLVTRVVDTSTGRHDADLAGFRSAVRAGVDMVMVSSAYYSRIDPGSRAAYSPVVITGMIRGDLDFTGVVVSDDLAAPGVRDLRPGSRAIRFLAAGGDLVIVGDPGRLAAMSDAVRDKAAADAAFRTRVAESARRVLAMKAGRGLADC
ncbi:glycoside hydrolase family 3 N-terminal domain-containing protein [Microlunatus ginsengisoli]|uniref:beta-N-acetylhexosaminidase n=1 Tax=Microlunatus ginsengisoli TaxID=363863 RepID=A0ABP6ZI03_9ACTN